MSSYGEQREAPRRPNIPPLAAAACAAWVAIKALYPTMCTWSGWECLACAAGNIFVLAATVGALAARKRFNAWNIFVDQHVFVSCCLAAVLLSCASCGLHAWQLHDNENRVDTEFSQQIVIRMSGDAKEGSYGGYGYGTVTSSTGATYKAKILFEGDDLPRFGDLLVTKGTPSAVPEDQRSDYWEEGCVASLNVYAYEKSSSSNLWELPVCARNAALDALEASSLDEDGKLLLEALVCGYRAFLSGASIYQAFKSAGLAHVVAVSGAHLAVLVALVAVLCRKLGLNKRLAAIIEVLFLGAYLLFSGCPVSALRAALMVATGLTSTFVRRRTATLSSWGFCVLLFAVLDPLDAYSVSFLLSAGSTGGILLFTPLFARWVQTLCPFMPSIICETLAVTAAASLITLPYSACLFSQLSLVSPLANLAIAPLFSLVCTVGLLAVLVALAVPSYAAVLFGGAGGLSLLLGSIVKLCAGLPYASVPFYGEPAVGLAVSAAVAMFLLCMWPMPSRRALVGIAGALSACMLSVLFVMPKISGARIVMLDVGQGDSFLVQDGDCTLLIDTGTNDSMLREALARQGITHLDGVLITHGDDDHYGSLTSLKGVVGVDQVLLSKYTTECTCENCTSLVQAAKATMGTEGIVALQKGDVISCGRFSFKVVWPAEFSDEGGNADSLCLYGGVDVDQDGKTDETMLFVGDAEKEQLAQIIEEESLSGVDLYKVGHHGSKVSVDEECAQALHPRLSLVSVGEGNRYGHPNQQVLEMLEASGSEIFRTDQQGDVCCNFTANSIEVTTER